MSSSLALQQAIFAVLTTDATLTTLLGGPRVHDGAPRGAAFPYVTFGQSRLIDWSTGTEAGDEHAVTLHAWSRTPGKKETLAILAAIRATLHDQPLTLSGYSLINLRLDFAEARREPDGETWHGLLRFRAVTE